MAQAKKIALALQGGGAHGAFTWGVLDALLDEMARGHLDLVGIGGASVGALNATALAYGCHQGAALPGPPTARTKRMAETARLKLQDMWETIARAAFWGGNPFVAAITAGPGWNIDDSAAARWADVATSAAPMAEVGISPYMAPVLREVLAEAPAIFALPQPGTPMLIVAATDVTQCRRQIFVDGAVSPEVLKATTCTPAPMHAVQIGEDYYWDGGYMGNPPLTPLVERLREADADDLIVVTVNPLLRAGPPPATPRHVADRLTEVAFNASLVHEVNAIETINRLIDAGMIKDPPPGQHPFRRVNLHRIHADDELASLGTWSKEAPAWDFLTWLRDLGRDAFRRHWEAIEPALGKRSSWDTKTVCDHILARAAITRREM
jgi:NTE family protein